MTAEMLAASWPAGGLFLTGGMPWGILVPVFLAAVAVGVWRGRPSSE